jgi:phage head maturation protease
MFSPIVITSTPSDVVRGWIGAATRAGYAPALVSRMAEAVDGTTEDVHAIARGSASHLDQLLDADLVQRLAGSVGASPLALSYRSVLRVMDGDEDTDEEQPEGMTARYRFVMSDAGSDRAEDIVEQSWDMSEFRANPVAPYNHDYSAPPIGRWENVSSDGMTLRGDLIPTPVESYPLSLTVAALLAQGVLRTVSVGFRPAAVIARASLAEDDPRFASRGAVYVRPRLMECSVTPMPMNPRAALARSAGEEQVARSVIRQTQETGLPYSPAAATAPRFPWT